MLSRTQSGRGCRRWRCGASIGTEVCRRVGLERGRGTAENGLGEVNDTRGKRRVVLGGAHVQTFTNGHTRIHLRLHPHTQHVHTHTHLPQRKHKTVTQVTHTPTLAHIRTQTPNPTPDTHTYASRARTARLGCCCISTPCVVGRSVEGSRRGSAVTRATAAIVRETRWRTALYGWSSSP